VCVSVCECVCVCERECVCEGESVWVSEGQRESAKEERACVCRVREVLGLYLLLCV